MLFQRYAISFVVSNLTLICSQHPTIFLFSSYIIHYKYNIKHGITITITEFNVIPVLITLGNTYGLLLVALLLGYGLVAFPRSLWRQASPEQELNKTFLHAVSIDDALYDAVWSLQEDVECDIDMALCRILDVDI